MTVCVFLGKVNYDPQGDVNIPAIEVVELPILDI